MPLGRGTSKLARVLLLIGSLQAIVGCSGGGGQTDLADSGVDDTPFFVGDVALTRPAGTAAETEPTLARAKDGRLAATMIAYRAGNGSTIGVSYSTDGGATFSIPSLFDPSASGVDAFGNAVVAFDDAGTTLVAMMGFTLSSTGAIATRRVFLASAPPGTSSFDAPVLVPFSGGELFKPWVIASTSGDVLVGAARGPSPYVIVVQRLRGGTFSEVSVPTDPSFRSEGHIYFCKEPSTGVIHLVNYVVDVKRKELAVLHRAYDGEAISPGVVRVSDPSHTVTDGPITCVASGDNVWVSYGVGTLPSNTDTLNATTTNMYVARSINRGVSFDSVVDAQATSGMTLAMLPTLIGGGGGLALFYYGAEQFDATGGLYVSWSSDEGASFAPPLQLGAGRIPMKRVTRAFAGDYFHGAGSARGASVVYADNSGADARVHYAGAAAPPVNK